MNISILPKQDRSFSGVLKYNQKDNSELIRLSNTTGCDVESFQAQLLKISNFNSRIKNPVFHASLNLAYDESELDEEIVLNIVDDYMKAMGYENQPYAVFKHTDKEHIHFHIVSSRVDVNTGKAISDRFEKKRTNTLTKELNEKYNLGINTETSRGLINNIQGKIQEVLKEKPYSYKVFAELLNERGVTFKKNGDVNVFFLNDESKGKQRAVKLSELTMFKDKSLSKILKTNYYYRKKAIEQIRLSCEKNIDLNAQIGEKELRDKLAQDNVFFKLHKNDAGIYGISFFANGWEIKGSQIGTNYSWNNLVDNIEVQTTDKPRTINQPTSKTQTGRKTYVQRLSQDSKSGKISIGRGIRESEKERKKRLQEQDELSSSDEPDISS